MVAFRRRADHFRMRLESTLFSLRTALLSCVFSREMFSGRSSESTTPQTNLRPRYPQRICSGGARYCGNGNSYNGFLLRFITVY